jgi:hypothetical protein
LFFGERWCRHGAPGDKEKASVRSANATPLIASAELDRTVSGTPNRDRQKTTAAAFGRWTVARTPRAH